MNYVVYWKVVSGGNQESRGNYNFKQGCWGQILSESDIQAETRRKGDLYSINLYKSGRVCSRQRDSQARTLRHKSIWGAQEPARTPV